MSVHLEARGVTPPQQTGTGLHDRHGPASIGQGSGRCVRVGLLNNMPDAAIKATERQFVSLLGSASKDLEVHLSLYASRDLPRGASAAAYLGGRYSSTEDLWDQQLDGLIVTGAEPVQVNLIDEPCWPMLSKLTDWARENTRSTIWSCLAAHAAVLKMDGIRRTRGTIKQSGIFECERLEDHTLTQGLPSFFYTPHSRWNGIAQADLVACGYRTLTRTTSGDVDMFTKDGKSLFVFFQGHPEYERDTLLREYRRDLARYLRGEVNTTPLLPCAYFDAETSDALTAVEEKALWHRSEVLSADISLILRGATITNTWHSNAVTTYKNWLQHISGEGATAHAIPSRQTSVAHSAARDYERGFTSGVRSR